MSYLGIYANKLSMYCINQYPPKQTKQILEKALFCATHLLLYKPAKFKMLKLCKVYHVYTIPLRSF